ncbi:hypothetical protein V1460_12585 [Streptomyces sp. SCSIO 30461]|uniref:hypothetical protein n=1 Tax=Streptomyces sp. SCSIO 30461 TaxID=3118085 RepID=UPI0030D4BD82
MDRVWQVMGGAVALSAALLLADRLLLWMERRDWICWRKGKSSAAMGVEFFQAVIPGAQTVKHSLEQERVRKNVRPAEGVLRRPDRSLRRSRSRRGAG